MHVVENTTLCSLFTNRLWPFRDFFHHTVTSINHPSSSHWRHEMFRACNDFCTVQSAESLSTALPLDTSTKRANSKRANHRRSRLFQDAVLSIFFLVADDGHDRCLQCLGLLHAEDAFVDDSCACCGRMSMISLQSRLSFLKGLTPSGDTRAGLSGSSRGSPAGALGDLSVTHLEPLRRVRPHGPLTPHTANIPSGSWVISLVRPTGRPSI